MEELMRLPKISAEYKNNNNNNSLRNRADTEMNIQAESFWLGSAFGWPLLQLGRVQKTRKELERKGVLLIFLIEEYEMLDKYLNTVLLESAI